MTVTPSSDARVGPPPPFDPELAAALSPSTANRRATRAARHEAGNREKGTAGPTSRIGSIMAASSAGAAWPRVRSSVEHRHS